MFYYLPNSPTSPSAPASANSIGDFTRRWSETDSARVAYATSNGKAMPRRSSWIGWRKRPWITRLSALAWTTSRQETSWAEWVRSLPEFPARGIPSPESAASPTTSEISGRKPDASCATAAPAFLHWRTSEASLFPTERKDSKLESAGLSTTWPKTGGWGGGELFELPTLEPITDASGFSCWPSAKASRRGDCPSERDRRSPDLDSVSKQWPTMDCNTSTYSNGHNGLENIREAAANWPIEILEQGQELATGGPNPDESSTTLPRTRQSGHSSPSLPWPTASARDHKGINQHLSTRGTLDQLPNAAEAWPPQEETLYADRPQGTLKSDGNTPQTPDKSGMGNLPNARSEIRGTGAQAKAEEIKADWQTPPANLGAAGCRSRSGNRIGEKLLTGQAKDWPTPQAHQGPNMSKVRENGRRARRLTDQSTALAAEKFPSSPPPETTTPNGSAYSELIRLLCRLFGVSTEAEFRAATKSLNPRFAAWLMGWEPDWAFAPTNFAASGTASCGCKPPSRSTNSTGDSSEGEVEAA